MGKILDTLLINVGKILDKSIKFTMLCIRVVGRNNRGFRTSQRGKIRGNEGEIRENQGVKIVDFWPS